MVDCVVEIFSEDDKDDINKIVKSDNDSVISYDLKVIQKSLKQ